MAFNPFHTFRKHQRKLLAALAVFCMFMFVVSSGLGRGDTVYQLLGLFGATRGRGSVVATLHGRKVTEGDLAKLRRDRDLASTFLFVVTRSGAASEIQKLIEAQNASRENKDAPPPDREISNLLMLWGMVYSERIPVRADKRYELAQNGLQTVRLRARLNETRNPEVAKQMDELGRVLAFEVWVNDPARNSKEYFFGGTPDPADLLDFLLWEQQADRLGIVLTEADVIAAVNHEAIDQNIVSGPTLNGDPLAQRFTSESSTLGRGSSPDQLADALRREFRYQLAQQAVLGREGGVRSVREGVVPQMPAAGTPREFLDWFRNHRTTVKVAVLPIPVGRFVNDVKQTPPESTLNDLYNAFKNDEPAPDRPTPGFKEPRRIRVETVGARSDSSFYQNAARAQAVATMAGALFGGPFGGPVSNAWPEACDPFWSSYSTYEADARFWVTQKIGVGVDLADRKSTDAAIAGLSIGATPGGLLSAATGAVAREAFHDVGLAKLAGSLLPAGVGSPLAAVALPFPYETIVLPQEQVAASMFARVIDGLAPKLVTKNLDEVVTEVAKLKSRPSEAQAYVAKAVKDFGLTEHLMAKAKTSYDLDTDPALQGLKAAVDAENQAMGAVSTSQSTTLAKVVLSGTGIYDPRRFPEGRFDRVKEPFVWWRVEDLPARERPFDVVRDQVVAAWRFDQARALARADAERIEEAVKKNVATNKSAAEAVKVVRSFGPDFELNDVARLLPVPTPDPVMGQPYQPYAVPHDLIPYPRNDFVDRLLALKEAGDVTVLRDKPAANLYVVVLEERSDPLISGSKLKLDAFLEEYRNADRSGSMWQQMFMQERRRAYVREVEKQMRIDAVGAKDIDEQGNIKLPDGIARGTETDSGE
jgi:hypothetical protein